MSGDESYWAVQSLYCLGISPDCPTSRGGSWAARKISCEGDLQTEYLHTNSRYSLHLKAIWAELCETAGHCGTVLFKCLPFIQVKMLDLDIRRIFFKSKDAFFCKSSLLRTWGAGYSNQTLKDQGSSDGRHRVIWEARILWEVFVIRSRAGKILFKEDAEGQSWWKAVDIIVVYLRTRV